MAFHPNSQERLLTAAGYDPVAIMTSAVGKKQPWESIVDFASHESFCGQVLYPRQLTLLKLMYLETEHMTSFDLEVIEEWRKGFRRRRDVFGVQPDIWERIAYLKARGARRFPHIQAVLGRRASKGFIGGILGAEQIAYFHSLDNWQQHFGVRPGKIGYLNVGATSLTQAKDHQFKDVRDVVESCKYLQPHIAESKDYMMSIRTPADLRMIAEMKAAKIPIEHPIATLEVQALSASSTAGRGATAFGIFLDEFAFMIHGTGSHKSGEEIYEDWMPSLDQFDLDGLTYIPSSPASKVGKCYSLYQEGSVLMSSYQENTETGEEAAAELKAMAAQGGNDTAEVVADPTKLVIQLPSWGLYENWEKSRQLIGVSFKRPIQPGPTHESQVRRKLRNPDKFKVEREGQWAEVQGAYFDPDMVERIFDAPGWRPALESQSRGYLTHKYRIHCDPGRTGANFALCIGHLENSPPDEHGIAWPHVIIDMLHVWRPQDFPPDIETGRPTIDYVQVQEDIDDILFRFPSTSKISFDQWNSAGMIASLRRKFSPSIRVAEVTFTERDNQARFERVKSALNLGWVHSYRDNFYEDNASLLGMELKFLSETNGRVERQKIGPVTTKDLCDAFCVVVSDLMHESLERYGSGDDLATGLFGSTSVSGLRSGRDQERMVSAGVISERAADNRARLAGWREERARARYTPDRRSSIHRRGG